MKKTVLVILSLSLILAFALSGCGKTTDKTDLAKYVSHNETGVYTGANANFSVSITEGNAEKLFVADGKVGETAAFSILKVRPLHIDLFNKSYTYAVTGSQSSISGTLSKDMFGASYITDLTGLDGIGDIQSLTLYYGSASETIELTDRLSGMIGWQDALKIANKEFADKITESKADDGTFPREIYIRLINDRSDPTSPYYWYVAYIADSSDYWAALIDPKTGEVVSKKT